MTTPTKIDAIRQKCIEVNPEIVELKFGCEMTTSEGNIIFTQSHEGCFYSGVKKSDFSFWNGYRQPDNNIIGRPIRLGDILRSIDLRMPHDSTLLSEEQNKCYQLIWLWNLILDDLTLQSPKTIDFIYNLLYDQKKES